MYKFNKKQKMLIVIVGIVIIGAIAYYLYSKSNTNELNINELEEENVTKNDENTNKEENNIIIHISGCVNKEGIVKLEANSRIADAIEKAGGLKENADISKINLAYLLEDGMKIYIPSVEETKAIESEAQENNEENNQTSKSTTYNAQTTNSTVDNTQNYITTTPNSDNKDESSKSSNKKININTATQAELETLPGIGPSTALKIINYRNESGKFGTIEDIKNVKGIGDSKFNNIKNYITVK